MGVIDSGMGWAIFGASFIFIFILLGILGENLRQKRKLIRQELMQKERIAMMEKGMPLPEWDSADLDEDGRHVSTAETHERNKQWFRLVSLAFGFLCCFTGLGLLLAFNMDPGNWRGVQTVGAIPFMAGLGLLLFYYLSREKQS